MLVNEGIKIKDFLSKKESQNQKKIIIKFFKKLIKSDNQIVLSMSKDYKNSFKKELILKCKNKRYINIIGIGGSSLGAKAIHSFLKPKKKIINFIDNYLNNFSKSNYKKKINLIISKSGNTLETISNSNILISKKEKNIFITEKKESYLMRFAKKLKAEIVHHNNFIGGRYSVLSEVGMLPAELMGFKSENFRQLNNLVKNKRFVNSLVHSVSNIINLHKKNLTNSIILNYDENSNDLFKWYQQLVAESLGKKNKGILPIISSMPKDNHSLMQHYIEGSKKNFFTLFFVKDKHSKKINSKEILSSHSYLKNKNLNEISFSQFCATEKVFNKRDIPFRSFIIGERNEKNLGELFTFFILETILLGRVLKINPFDQPAVELIKKQTKKFLISKNYF